MRRLLTVIALAFLFAIPTQAQNTIQNFTNSESLTNMVSNGLEELDIDSTTITILPMKKYYKSAKQASNGKPWGATIGAGTRTFTIIISTRHEAEVGLSFEERIAHELIHVKQGYDGDTGNEKEAYQKQYKLAELINQ